MPKDFSVPKCMDCILLNFYEGRYVVTEVEYGRFTKATIESAMHTLWLLGLIHHNPYKLSHEGEGWCIGGYKFYRPGGNSYEAILRCRLRHVQAMPNEVTIE